MSVTAAGALRSVDTLLREASQYLPPPDLDKIRQAYEYAAEAHAGQQRASGEPYVNHPLAAAETVAELRLDADSIVATLLHDVPEDTGTPLAEIERRFGA